MKTILLIAAAFAALALPVKADETVYKLQDGYAGLVPGNQFFDQSLYAHNCPTPYINGQTGQLDDAQRMTFTTTYACEITAAPVVDMSFVTDKLQAQGYTFAISYPFENQNSGRALVYWMKPCNVLSNGSPYTPMNCDEGMARLTGAGWTNQFASVQVPKYSCEGSCFITGYTTMPYGSAGGAYIAAWSEPVRGVGTVATRWGYNVEGPVWSVDKYSEILYDNWLAGGDMPVAPVLPPAPGQVGPASASNLTFGGSGTASAAGSGTTAGVADGRGGIPFDYAAYCSAPDPSGVSRTPAWIANCLKSN